MEESGFEGLALVLLFASVLLFMLWAVVLGVLWAASFPRLPSAGPETTDLGPEPPAISNLLVHRFKVTHAAMPATLLDLAARRLLEIQMLGRDNFVIRVRPGADTSSLLPYERQLYDWVRNQATGGSAPLEALSVGNPGRAQGFWNRFQREVISDARKRGLVRNRWARGDWTVLGVILAAAFGLLALSFGAAGVGDSGEDPMDVGDWLLFAAFGWGGVLAVITRFQDLRDTKHGQEVAGRWLGVRNAFRKSTAFGDAPPSHVTIWERNMSHAVAMGLAHEAVRQLPFEEEDPETAWTRQTGVWREIEISYPSRFGWGERPLWVLWGGLWRIAVWGGLAFIVVPTASRILFDVAKDFRTSNSDQIDQIDPMALNGIIAVIVAIIGGWTAFLLVRFSAGVIRLWRALSDLGKPPVVIEGEVVKLHMGRIAVDDGKVEETKGWIPPPTAPALTRGMKVRYSRTPNLWHVSKVEILALPGGAEPRQATAREPLGGTFAGAPAFNIGAINAATGLSLVPLVRPGGVDADSEIMGTMGPFGRAVASETLGDGDLEVLVVKLDPSELGGLAGTVLNFMTSKAQQRMAQFDGAGESGFWMGEDMLVVNSGQTRYAVRVSGNRDVPERQRIAEQIAHVVVGGRGASPAPAAGSPASVVPGGAASAPMIIAAAAAAAVTEAKSTSSAEPALESTVRQAATATADIDVSPSEQVGAIPAAEFPGWGTPESEAARVTSEEPELGAFVTPEPAAAPPPEIEFTPPPIFPGDDGSPAAVQATDFPAVPTADGRVIIPVEVRGPSSGFPRPGRRFGPGDGTGGELSERAASAMEVDSWPAVTQSAQPAPLAPPDTALSPEPTRGFPRPRQRVDDRGERVPAPETTTTPVEDSQQPPLPGAPDEATRPRPPSRDPFRR